MEPRATWAPTTHPTNPKGLESKLDDHFDQIPHAAPAYSDKHVYTFEEFPSLLLKNLESGEQILDHLLWDMCRKNGYHTDHQTSLRWNYAGDDSYATPDWMQQKEHSFFGRELRPWFPSTDKLLHRLLRVLAGNTQASQGQQRLHSYQEAHQDTQETMAAAILPSREFTQPTAGQYQPLHDVPVESAANGRKNKRYQAPPENESIFRNVGSNDLLILNLFLTACILLVALV
ncbi:MAG: hypothetical protein L6R40_004381, partial [Gallowayella cf. fulva]